MRRLALIPILFALISLAPLAAQDTPPDTGWPVELRCVGDPIPPPDDWTWEGTIFTYKPDEGIRGLRADIPTSYHVTYEGDAVFNSAGAFSPDLKWFAVPVGETYYPRTLSPATSYYAVYSVAVYSTNLARKIFLVPWQVGYNGYDTSVISPIFWLDNEHLVYEKIQGYTFGEPQFEVYTVNPFTQAITAWVKPFDPYKLLYGSSVSPDGSKILYLNDDDAAQNAGWGLYDFESGKQIASLMNFERGVWFSNSTQFIGIISDKSLEEGNADRRMLALFDLSRNLQEIVIYLFTKRPISIAASNDMRYIVFDDGGNLLLANVPKKQIYDLCFHFQYVYHPKWSPDSTQLAFTDNERIMVLDTRVWQLYELPYEIGDVVAWGAAE